MPGGQAVPGATLLDVVSRPRGQDRLAVYCEAAADGGCLAGLGPSGTRTTPSSAKVRADMDCSIGCFCDRLRHWLRPSCDRVNGGLQDRQGCYHPKNCASGPSPAGVAIPKYVRTRRFSAPLRPVSGLLAAGDTPGRGRPSRLLQVPKGRYARSTRRGPAPQRRGWRRGEGHSVEFSLLRHVSPIEWDNIVLYGGAPCHGDCAVSAVSPCRFDRVGPGARSSLGRSAGDARLCGASRLTRSRCARGTST